MNQKVTVNAGTPLTVLLTILFVALKLTGYITWSWLWVLSHMWIPIVCVVLFLSFVAIFLDGRKKKKMRRRWLWRGIVLT